MRNVENREMLNCRIHVRNDSWR